MRPRLGPSSFRPAQTLVRMWVTGSAQIHRITPEPTSATWNRVDIFGFLAPPSMWMTSAIHQSSDSLLPTITVTPALTLRNSGGGCFELQTEWSTDTAPINSFNSASHGECERSTDRWAYSQPLVALQNVRISVPTSA